SRVCAKFLDALPVFGRALLHAPRTQMHARRFPAEPHPFSLPNSHFSFLPLRLSFVSRAFNSASSAWSAARASCFLRRASNLAATLDLNYRGFLGSCLAGEFTVPVDVLQVQADVVGADVEELRHFALAEPDGVVFGT